jgi:hypothetical protein
MFQMETFTNPGPAYGIHPFWFWNGEMEDGEIVHQIEEMVDKGLGGFFICPRQGLQVPYLSDEWFQKVRLAVKTAERLGMNVWLYDEYPYPSGIAGGEVTLAHPEAKHYTLKHVQDRLVGGQPSSLELPWARVLYAKAVPIDPGTGEQRWEQAIDIRDHIGNHQSEPIFQKAGLTAYNQKRFFTYKTVKKLQWTAPAGAWEVHCFLEQEIEDFKYYGTFVDPCNEEAMRTFIALTHERYAREIGEYFGGTVKGMFTDEIGLLGDMPWSPRLLQAFKERNGYDLQDRLHALLFQDGETSSKIRYDYYQTIHLLLRSSYHKQVHDWCEKHGLQYVAEVPSVRMTTQLYSHVPAGDSGHEKLGRSLEWILDKYAPSLRYNPKMVSSLANQLARERVLIECFHSVGWSMTLQDAKWMIDRLAAMGINFYNFHAFFYTLDGLMKHDAPPSQFLQNPYWKHFGMLGAYVRRISYVMSSGVPERSIAVLDPTTTFWTHMGNPFHEFQYGGEDAAEKQKLEQLKADWFAVCKTLTLNQRDFDHLDPELLAEAVIEAGVIRLGNAAYTTLILPSLTNLEVKAWRKIKIFIEQGGTVISVGLLPNESIDGTTQVESEMKEMLDCVPLGQLIPLLDQLQPETIRLRSDAPLTSFLMQRRRLEDGSTLVFVSNQEGGTHHAMLSLNGRLSHVQATRLDLATGAAASVVVNDGGILLDFAPYESVLLRLQETPTAVVERNEAIRTRTWNISAVGLWDMQAEGDNAVRFDTFELQLASGEDGHFTQDNSTIVQAKTFIDQCEDIACQQRLPLRFSQLFGTPMKLSAAYPIRCRYTVTFQVEQLPSVCYMLKDQGAIGGNYILTINDCSFTEEHFSPQFVYDHRNQTCDVQAALKPGLNSLTVEVTVEHDWDGVVDALYLCGDFAVQFDDSGRPALSEPRKKSTLHSGPIDGYPFYAGTIAFKRLEELENVSGGDTFDRFTMRLLDGDPHFHDCAEVLVNGHSLGVRSWSPYEWSGSSSLLREGMNEIEVKVTNTLIGLLEGKTFNYETHTLQDVAAK